MSAGPSDEDADAAAAAAVIREYHRWYEVHRIPPDVYLAYDRPIVLRRPPVVARGAAELATELERRRPRPDGSPVRPERTAAEDEVACPFFACPYPADHWWIVKGAPPEWHRTPVRLLCCRNHFHILRHAWAGPADA